MLDAETKNVTRGQRPKSRPNLKSFIYSLLKPQNDDGNVAYVV